MSWVIKAKDKDNGTPGDSPFYVLDFNFGPINSLVGVLISMMSNPLPHNELREALDYADGLVSEAKRLQKYLNEQSTSIQESRRRVMGGPNELG